MTSNADIPYREAYVWTWLPGANSPVVAGLLSQQGEQLVFNYGRSYLARSNAIPLYTPELPLQLGIIPLLPGLIMPSCLRDASPDAWGRRVLINHKFGVSGLEAAKIELNELTYLLESGSDRIGALDFQLSSSHYKPRSGQKVSLEELMIATEKIECGQPLSPELDQALQHGTSLGGARPKVLIEEENLKLIAKFSSGNDLYNVVKAEFIAMRLAQKVGLNVAPVRLTKAIGKDVLLIERFDRTHYDTHWQRRAMVSALTLLELDEMMAAYASYEKLAVIIRHRFVKAKATLRELFGRITFNILCGNTDDHARNHAAFWDGHQLALTPAYDICPQPRVGEEASQAMLIYGRDRRSQIASCLAAAPIFQMGLEDAINLINHQVSVIEREWHRVSEEANLSQAEHNYFWKRHFLNPFAFYDAPASIRVPLK
jgi:serine/threonine-protein kinase HipA